MTSPSNSHPGGTTATGATVNQALVSGYLADNPNLSAGALSAARHLLRWATDRQITISDLDATAVDRFARHRCRCGRYSAAQLRNPSYMTDARRFLRYLEGIGRVVIPTRSPRSARIWQPFQRTSRHKATVRSPTALA